MSIPREMVEQRAAEIARKQGRAERTSDLDLAQAEDQLRTELDGKQEERQVPDMDTPLTGRSGLDPKDNPAPPSH